MLPGPVGDGHSVNTETLPPPGLGPHHPHRAWHRVGVRELAADGHTGGVQRCQHSYFTNAETGVQRGEVTCPVSQLGSD